MELKKIMWWRSRGHKTIFEIEKEIQEEEVKKKCDIDEKKAKKLGIDLEAVRFLSEPRYITPTFYPLICPTLEYMWRKDGEGNLYEINMRIAKIVSFYTAEEQKKQRQATYSLFVMGDKLYAEKNGHMEEVIPPGGIK